MAAKEELHVQKEEFGAQLQIGELSRLTGVKATTIRFYERCGFLEPAERLPNQYRVFHVRHIYQVRICRLVFGGFVNRRLRKISTGILKAARDWNLEGYDQATKRYLQAVEEDIAGTRRAIATVTQKLHGASVPLMENDAFAVSDNLYSKKQAAQLVGATPDAVRNWERNGLLGQAERYKRRFYSRELLERMYVIRLLLDSGYSMMAIKSFFAQLDAGNGQGAADTLISPGDNEDLIYRADRYLETLENEKKKAEQLCALSGQMH